MSDSVVPYLISAAFGLLGVLIGGGLQILAQHRSAQEQRKRQQIDFQRSKLEELFEIGETSIWRPVTDIRRRRILAAAGRRDRHSRSEMEDRLTATLRRDLERRLPLL